MFPVTVFNGVYLIEVVIVYVHQIPNSVDLLTVVCAMLLFKQKHFFSVALESDIYNTTTTV